VNNKLGAELQSTCVVSNPDFNYLIPIKDFDSFIRNNFSCNQCLEPIMEEDLVSV
jgi:hypothetical protein